ncbi:hypothetical protein KKC60_04010 [Patescibacteria group bacterium]|nr:hypothetical protein [Patescibacteria group bacterium]
MTDPLDKLIVDEEKSPNLETLANSVNGYLRVSKQGTILYDKTFHKLPNNKKVLLYLLARKIISIKGLRENFTEGIKSNSIGEEIGVEYKDVRTYLSGHLKGVVKNDNGLWFIPNYNLHKCEEMMKNDKTKRSN